MPAPHAALFQRLSPEMALLVTACRWPATAERDAAIRTAADGVDWALILRLGKRHRVIGLLATALLGAGVVMPANVVQALMRQAGRIGAVNDALAGETARLQGMLDAAGITALVVKGVPLAMLAYGTVALKQAKDIDLLVMPDDVARGLALLIEAGYRLIYPAPSLTPRQLRDVIRYETQMELVRDSTPRIQVELHWGLARNLHVLPGLNAGAPQQRVDLGAGRVAATLQCDDLFAYLCAHGASHGWFRVKWLADVAALIASVPPEERERLYRSAQAKGEGWSAGQALVLIEDLFALPLPSALSAELRADRSIRRLVAAAFDLIAGPGADQEMTERRFGFARVRFADWLQVRDRHDLRSGIARYLTVMPDVLAVPLPPRLHFLYPVLRLPLGLLRVARKRSGGH